MNRQEFYSMDEWIEYVQEFMGNARISIDNNEMVVKTERGVPLGVWHKGKGMVIEKRAMSRLVKEKGDG